MNVFLYLLEKRGRNRVACCCAKGWQIEEEKGLMTRGEVLRVMTALGGIDNLCFFRFGLASLGGAEVCNVFCHAYSLPYVQTYTYTLLVQSYT